MRPDDQVYEGLYRVLGRLRMRAATALWSIANRLWSPCLVTLRLNAP
jgi:hypothetical protein